MTGRPEGRAAPAGRGGGPGRLAAPLLALGSLALSFAAGEAAVRLALGRRGIEALPHAFLDESAGRKAAWRARREAATTPDPYGFDAPDPRLGWRLAPGVDVRSSKPGSYDVRVGSNPQGLRGSRPASLAPSPGVVRVAIFGDSQTFGEGVGDDETFAAVLGRGRPSLEVLNFGVHGYGTDQMLLRWREDGRRFHPDVVVLAIAWFHADRNASDFTFYAKPRFAFDGDGLIEPPARDIPPPARLAVLPADPSETPCGLADRSALVRWLWQRVLNLRAREAQHPDGAPWRLTRALVARFAEEVRREGARFVLLDIDDERPELGADLRRLAGEIGADYVAVGPAVSAAERAGESVRLVGDRHWSARGHEVVAAELGRRLCEAIAGACAPGAAAGADAARGAPAGRPGTPSSEPATAGAGSDPGA